MKKRVFICFIFSILVLIIFTGCSTKPKYVEDSYVYEIAKYNFGSSYKFVEKLSYPDPYDEKVTIYEYVYKNDNRDTFSIYSTASKMGEPFSGFYSTYVYDDYVAKKIEQHKYEIESVFLSNGLSYEIKKDSFDFTISKFEDIAKIAKAVYKAKEIMKLEETGLDINDKYVIKNTFSTSITLNVGSTSCYTYRTIHKDDTEAKIKSTLENSMLDKATNLGIINDIGATAEALNNFHIEKAYYDIEKFTGITFYYDENLGDYYTSDLSICLNYDKYDYNHNDNMQKLIESKGGTFSRNGWKNTWALKGNTFEAEMTVDSKKEFQDLVVKKNGTKIDLEYSSSPLNKNSIFQQYFTRRTLERMLGLTIQIDNDGTVNIY